MSDEEEKDWREYMPHPKDKPDFDRDTAWDMIGLLTMIVAIETTVIIILTILILFWIL